MHRPEYGVSGGTNIFHRGNHNPVPVHNYLSGTGKSHVYRGPGWYVPLDNSWVSYAQYRAVPEEARKVAILFESEDSWVEYQRARDLPVKPSGTLYILFLHQGTYLSNHQARFI